MAKFLRVFAAVLMGLTITNCSMFGGKAEDKDAYEDANSAYGEAPAAQDAEAETPDAYVSPDTFGDADAEESEKAPLNMDNEGYNGDDNAQADVTFGENEEAPETNTPAASANREMSAVSFKQGMYDFAADCKMKEEPNAKGTPAGTVKAGKKLWVEPFDNNWLRVYKKAGPVYIKRDCL